MGRVKTTSNGSVVFVVLRCSSRPPARGGWWRGAGRRWWRGAGGERYRIGGRGTGSRRGQPGDSTIGEADMLEPLHLRQRDIAGRGGYLLLPTSGLGHFLPFRVPHAQLVLIRGD